MAPSRDFPLYGSWQPFAELGKGGQGTIFLSRRKIEELARPELPDLFSSWVHGIGGANPDFRRESVEKVFDLFRRFCEEQNAPLAALKVLHGRTTGTKALERMKRELGVLESFTHPSLVKVIESRLDEGWFAMEYFPGGTLSKHLNRFCGDLLASLISLRPLVSAVAYLHEHGVVHRDIKPDNVFLKDGGQLVLGDCGLVFHIDSTSPRVTETYENVGSRDWMPGWAMGMRIEEVKPTFDVFSLGKLLWSMVSGKTRLQLWYHHDPEFELEKMFPDDPSIKWARYILDKCIVERENQCFPNAGVLLGRMDVFIRALKQNAQLPSQGPISCRICGLGDYAETIRSEVDLVVLACNYCGNMQSFHKGKVREGWQ